MIVTCALIWADASNAVAGEPGHKTSGFRRLTVLLEARDAAELALHDAVARFRKETA